MCDCASGAAAAPSVEAGSRVIVNEATVTSILYTFLIVPSTCDVRLRPSHARSNPHRDAAMPCRCRMSMRSTTPHAARSRPHIGGCTTSPMLGARASLSASSLLPVPVSTSVERAVAPHHLRVSRRHPDPSRRRRRGRPLPILLHHRPKEGRLLAEQRELRSCGLAHREAIDQLLLHPQQTNR